MKENSLDRRSFLVGSMTAGAAVATAGILGCAPQAEVSEPKEASDTAAEETAIPKDISEVLETDICIIGAGLSGLACAVRAAENGTKPLVLEKNSVTGGNGGVVEGTFAIGTSLAKENGFEVTEQQVINHEMGSAQYRVDGALWRKFVEASKDNWDWMVEQGCEFSGAVETYGGLYSTFHWFKGGEGSEGYVPQMTARAEELGVDFRFSTPAFKLIVADDGKTITGCYAEDSQGNNLQINAKATVIATGGWGSNEELVAKMGFDVTDYWEGGLPYHDGDGYKMAVEIGAMDRLSVASQLALNIVPALPKSTFKHPYNGIVGISSGMAPSIWVNQDAIRFANESILLENMMLQAIPGREQEAVYTIFDQNIWNTFTADIEEVDPQEELAEAVENNNPASLWKADTFAELASKVGIDAGVLQETIEEYNADCKTGAGDHVFDRPAEMMIPIENPPYYIARNRLHFVSNFGGVGTNHSFQILDEDKEPFVGLYAAGVDGEMRYRNIYPINIGGTASAGCVWSGRVIADEVKNFIR